ncbi:hypothetical protein HYW74_04180 [Candidatus Pacearchaeota archaeon]|nr:hypothetical protein [Candidatus Pacearchaeota archaeon]
MITITPTFVNGSTLLGVALSLFGIGFIVPKSWQKVIMFSCAFIYLIMANLAFFAK